MRLSTLLQTAVLAATAAAPLSAQWVTFQDETNTRLVAASSLGSADAQEKDYAWADLDQDGDVDLICVRKQPFTSSGHFPNVLFMNENGVLTDRSGTLTSSTVAGSSGFLDATNDRDVVICDVDGDGWLDVVTCTTLTNTMPKYIRVPRVYINRGNDPGGNWLGLLYDDENRIDDTPWGGFQRFCSVAAGDVDGDGDVDLYFGDYQQGGNRPSDIDDRLLINDGTGYFTDQTSTRMTYQMVESSFGMKVAILDMNGDGKLDILKDDALNAPQAVSISYNDTAVEGMFGSYQLAYGNAPYHFNTGDLNNDSLPDLIVSDDGQDRYMIQTGVSGGQAQFTQFAFTYSGGGSDDGFGGNNLIADLNNDGFADAIVADVDVDIAGYNRRCHIFRNLGNVPNVTMQEQIVSGQVVGGISTANLTCTFDVAVFDINGDSWPDMVIGTCNGTKVWMNQPPGGMAISYPGGLPTMLTPGATTQLDVNATGIGAVQPVAGTGRLHYSINGGSFQTVVMSDLGPGQFRATLPALPNCADELRFYVAVGGNNAVTYNDPPVGASGAYTAFAATGLNTIYENNFETSGAGWTVQNTAVTFGAWERVIPVGTTNGAQIAAPFDDAEAGANNTCYVTGNGLAGGTAGASDLDGGPTDLISPPIDFAGTDGFISYQRWLYSSTTDQMVVSVSGDGVNWTTVETVTAPGNNQWTGHQFRVSDFITPTATVRVRFRISDNPNDSVTEGGVDVFRAEAFSCVQCQDVYALQTVGNATLSICGGDLQTPGSFSTLAVESMPAFTTGLLLFDVFPFPTPWNGGQLISPGPIVLGTIFADANGDFIVPVPLGGLLPPGWALYTQAVYTDGAQAFGVGMTNGVKVQW